MRLIVAVLMNALVTSPLAAQSRGACLASSPGVSQVRDAIANLVTSSDTLAVRYRAEKNLPVVKAARVTVVSDSATCARASFALARIRSDMDPHFGAWVIRVGDTRYVAFNGRLRGLENSLLLVVYDAQFARLSTLEM